MLWYMLKVDVHFRPFICNKQFFGSKNWAEQQKARRHLVTVKWKEITWLSSAAKSSLLRYICSQHKRADFIVWNCQEVISITDRHGLESFVQTAFTWSVGSVRWWLDPQRTATCSAHLNSSSGYLLSVINIPSMFRNKDGQGTINILSSSRCRHAAGCRLDCRHDGNKKRIKIYYSIIFLGLRFLSLKVWTSNNKRQDRLYVSA